MPAASPATIAALVAPADSAADYLLPAFIAALQRAGRRVRGLLQEYGAAGLALVDLETGRRYGIAQDLGPLSAACALDQQALAEAGQVLRRIVEHGADLAVFNRFAGLEASGRGFADEMLTIMSSGIPTLVVVRPQWLPAWRQFTGGLAAELPAETAALAAWFAAADRRG